jgi:hypothetical protein
MRKREYLKVQLKEHAGRFKEDSEEHKRMFRVLRYGAFFLTAVTTALASLALAFPPYNNNISVAIVALTALTGVLTSVEGLRKPGELWIHERTTYYALLDLQRQLEFQEGDPEDPSSVDRMFAQLQAILGASGEKWTGQIVGNQGKEKN